MICCGKIRRKPANVTRTASNCFALRSGFPCWRGKTRCWPLRTAASGPGPPGGNGGRSCAGCASIGGRSAGIASRPDAAAAARKGKGSFSSLSVKPGGPSGRSREAAEQKTGRFIAIDQPLLSVYHTPCALSRKPVRRQGWRQWDRSARGVENLLKNICKIYQKFLHTARRQVCKVRKMEF